MESPPCSCSWPFSARRASKCPFPLRRCKPLLMRPLPFLPHFDNRYNMYSYWQPCRHQGSDTAAKASSSEVHVPNNPLHGNCL